MKIGKVSEPILKRSILKEIRKINSNVIQGSGIANDYAALGIEEVGSGAIMLSTNPITGACQNLEYYGLHKTINNFVTSGYLPKAVSATLLLPPSYMESDLKAIMRHMHSVLEPYKIQLVCGHTEVIEHIKFPILSFAAIGYAEIDRLVGIPSKRIIEPDSDVVMTKFAGIEMTAYLAEEKEEVLLERFSPGFIRQAKEFSSEISVVREALIGANCGVSVMHNISSSGVYGALWEVAEANAMGIEVELKKIPIKQETIEICEYFDLNPYQIKSEGALLLIAKEGAGLVDALRKEGIEAAMIGKMKKGNERVITNEDERRYLEPPKGHVTI